MTNKVCYEPKETKPLRRRAQEMTRGSFNPSRTAFLGRRISAPGSVGSEPDARLYLVTDRCVFQADQPRNCYVDTQTFLIEKWVDVEIYVKE